MSEEGKTEVSEGARKIVGAMIDQALARCERLGIAWEDFHKAMLAEQKLHPTVSVAELIEQTFRRLGGLAN